MQDLGVIALYMKNTVILAWVDMILIASTYYNLGYKFNSHEKNYIYIIIIIYNFIYMHIISETIKEDYK